MWFKIVSMSPSVGRFTAKALFEIRENIDVFKTDGNRE